MTDSSKSNKPQSALSEINQQTTAIISNLREIENTLSVLKNLLFGVEPGLEPQIGAVSNTAPLPMISALELNIRTIAAITNTVNYNLVALSGRLV